MVFVIQCAGAKAGELLLRCKQGNPSIAISSPALGTTPSNPTCFEREARSASAQANLASLKQQRNTPTGH